MTATIIPFPDTAWRETLGELADNIDHLSTAEYLFCAAISERRRLTERQLDDLHRLVCNVRQRARVQQWRAAAGGAA